MFLDEEDDDDVDYDDDDDRDGVEDDDDHDDEGVNKKAGVPLSGHLPNVSCLALVRAACGCDDDDDAQWS